MARTNKMGILKKKQQQAKQKKLGGEGDAQEGLKQSHENPKGSTYQWFMRNGKWVCDETSQREDPDGYRIQRKANGGELTFVYRGQTAWGYRKRFRSLKKMQKK